MIPSRTYNQMTVDEKRQSVELWKRFYQSLREKNYEASWIFWNKRLDYLDEIGIFSEKSPKRNEIFRNL